MIQFRLYNIFCLIFVLFNSVLGKENTQSFSFINNSTTRAVAMGGAFTAVRDGLVSVHYNPAAFVQYKYKKTPKFAIYTNPVGISAAINNGSDLAADGKIGADHFLGALGLAVKSISFSTTAFSVGLDLAENLPNNPWQQNNSQFGSDGFLDWNYNTLAFSIKLADQVSMGAAGYYVRAKESEDTTIRSFASSYGVFVNPSPFLSIGVSYFDYPQTIADLMFAKNKSLDESINIGIAFKPASFFLITTDVKNVSENTTSDSILKEEHSIYRGSNELHVGCELTVFSMLALRSGFYRINDISRNVYSFGLGILDTNMLHSVDNQLAFKDFLLNYALQVEEFESTMDYRHFLTFLIRL